MTPTRGVAAILGTSEIGVALAKRLLSKGFALHFAGRNGETLKKLSDTFIGSSVDLFDARDSKSIEATIKQAEVYAKSLDGECGLKALAYCVGSIPLKSLRAATADDFIDAFTINTVGAAVAIKAAYPFMSKVKHGGSVVLFSSIAVQRGFPMHSIISSAKGGLEGLTRAMAAELAPNIRVNAIAPSLTDTPLASNILRNDAAKESFGKMHPIPRIGTADDHASLASWLLDNDESSWVTGQIIGVDGGRSSIIK